MKLQITDGEDTFIIPWTGQVPRKGDFIRAEERPISCEDPCKLLSGFITKVIWEFLNSGDSFLVTLCIEKD